MPVLKHFQVDIARLEDDGDSPLSMIASVAGILTLAVALSGATWLWVKLAIRAREELRVVEITRQWHLKETTWLHTSILAEDARGPQHTSNLATEKIQAIQRDLDLSKHLESLQQQKDKAIEMTKILSKELQALDSKLPPILLRTTTSHSTASERRRQRANDAARRMTTGEVHEVVHFSDPFYDSMMGAAKKVSAANRLLWLPFRSDALDTIKQMEEVRNRLLFVQLAMLDMKMVDNELKTATHERLLVDMWEILKRLQDTQGDDVERYSRTDGAAANGNG